MSRRPASPAVRSTWWFVALSLVAATATAGGPAEPPVFDCTQADLRLTVRESARLDPSCTWTGGVRIVASDVVFDCQGATIAGEPRGRGIEISAPADIPLGRVTVRNCHVEGFLNSVRITRDGFRDLAEGVEYNNAFTDIVIEDSTFRGSRGVGVFVDGYVTGVTLRNLRIEGAGSSGIYLETGSKDTVVDNCDIVGNGFVENGPRWQPFDLGGQSFWFWGTGREGLSIDGARFNRIVGNRFEGNSYGSIFLYKNCGEYPDSGRWFERRHHADGNVIEGNTFRNEDNGVWIAARMGENTLPMECSDPQYRFGYVLDYAADNIIRDNTFEDVTFGVRVEDDRNTISGNHFIGDAAQQAVVVGTRYRTTALDRPVSGTTIVANTADIPANPEPYRWLYRHTGTDFDGNTSLGEPAQLCVGVPPWTGPFVMTEVVRVGGSASPPTEPPRPLPAPEPLPPCPCAGDCGDDGQVTVDEIVRGVTLALGEGDVFDCAAVDTNADGTVTVDELVRAIVAALEGC